MMKKIIVLLTLALIVMGSISALAWEPTEEVEFVVHNDPGSGTDLFVRTVAKALTKNGIVDDIKVVNRPGAGGLIARRYVSQQKGNPHVLSGATESWITRGRINPGDLDYTNFTQVAHLLGEPLTVVVKADSPYETLADLVEAARENPEGVSQGGPNIGTAEWLGGRLLESETGVKFNYVSFGQTGSLMPQILGGHVDFIFNNPGEVIDYVETGQLRFLAIATPTRSDMFPEVPTFNESGINMELFGPRGFYAGPEMPEEAQEFWVSAFERAMETEVMKDYLSKTLNMPIFRAGDEYITFIQNYEDSVIPLLKEAELIK